MLLFIRETALQDIPPAKIRKLWPSDQCSCYLPKVLEYSDNMINSQPNTFGTTLEVGYVT